MQSMHLVVEYVQKTTTTNPAKRSILFQSRILYTTTRTDRNYPAIDKKYQKSSMNTSIVPPPPPPKARTSKKRKRVLTKSTDLPTLSPPATTTFDISHALPAPFLTINPGMLGDATWSLHALQTVCTKLSLCNQGERDTLVDRLVAWHREKLHKDGEQEEADMDEDEETREQKERERAEDEANPLSIRKHMKNAANFNLFALETDALLHLASSISSATTTASSSSSTTTRHGASPLSTSNSSSSSSLHPSKLPGLLAPLIYKATKRNENGTLCSILRSAGRGVKTRTNDKKNKKTCLRKRLCFSVFNGVKLIPRRRTSTVSVKSSGD